jgi:hypothetical protein
VFTLFGHPDVRLLDGGATCGSPTAATTTLDVPSKRPRGYPVVERDDARSALQGRRAGHLGPQPLIDVRSPQEYTGERTHMPDYPEEGALRGGHIPTAGRSRGARRPRQTDGSAAAPSSTSCTASFSPTTDDRVLPHRRAIQHNLVRADPSARLPGVRNYDGSWDRVGQRGAACPVLVGPETGGDAWLLMSVHPPQHGRGGVGLPGSSGQDKLQLLLEFANDLPPLPPDLEEAAMEPVPECQSPLFLHVDASTGTDVRLHFSAPAEATTTRGFAAILRCRPRRASADGHPGGALTTSTPSWASRR